MADKYVKLDDIIETLEHEWGYEGMREDLQNLPTADVVEVKQGEWIKPQFVAHRGFYEVKEFKCSVCNKTYEVKQPCNLMNYCP